MDLDREGEDEEPVFELGPETDTEEDLPVRRGMPLDTLLTPEALALAGLVLALLAALSPVSNLALIFVGGPDVPESLSGPQPNTLVLVEDGPSKVWLLGPPAGQAGAGLVLGLVSWWRALVLERDLPRLAGAAVVIAAAVIVFVAVIWFAAPGPPPSFGL